MAQSHVIGSLFWFWCDSSYYFNHFIVKLQLFSRYHYTIYGNSYCWPEIGTNMTNNEHWKTIAIFLPDHIKSAKFIRFRPQNRESFKKPSQYIFEKDQRLYIFCNHTCRAWVWVFWCVFPQILPNTSRYAQRLRCRFPNVSNRNVDSRLRRLFSWGAMQICRTFTLKTQVSQKNWKLRQ